MGPRISNVIRIATAALLCVPILGTPLRAAPHAVDLLPNLVALPPFEIVLSKEDSGCDTYETVEEGADRCLRYDTVVGNFGQGPLELRYRVDMDRQLRQRIYRSDRSFFELWADSYELHPIHGHFHYANFALARLWEADSKGRTLGSEPVRESDKAGFCLYDGENYWGGRKRSVPRRYKYPEACRPNEMEGAQLSQVNGLSRGWVDVYDYELSDQYIDVSGLEQGYYILEIVLDPLNTLRESRENDNSVSILIFLDDDEDDGALFPLNPLEAVQAVPGPLRAPVLRGGEVSRQR